jgi:nucleotide-binding universal stress UspA family protein
VVGRRGAGVVERLVLGSVADRLAHEAPCPVLIVP